MSEFAEDMRAFKEYSKEKKAANREKSTALLIENGIKFESRNDGLHLIIQTLGGRVNFYPSTGLYNGVLSGRGVFTLMEAIKRLETAKKQEEKAIKELLEFCDSQFDGDDIIGFRD